MDAALARWTSCRAVVAKLCAGRPATHGLAHMEQVTQLSLLIASMERSAAPTPDVVLVAMLHDVADHKYDRDGTLEAQVKDAIAALVADDFPDDAKAAAAAATHAWNTIDAISYSKEKKRGMRYFEATLPKQWVAIRDIVSDADKLLAIGEDGVRRCWEFQLEMHEGRVARGEPGLVAPTPASVTKDVVQHAHDKLLRLKDEFMVTPSGKYLAEPKHDEMVAVFKRWEVAPPTTLQYA